MKNCTVIDLFCGAGALTHGFILEGFDVVAGLDADKSCKYAYETNNPGATFIEKKIEDVKAAELKQWYPEGHVKILRANRSLLITRVNETKMTNGNYLITFPT